jgi:DNA processing protein
VKAPALRDWLALIRAPGIGPVTAGRLLGQFGGPAAVLAAGPSAWRRAGLDERLFAGLLQPDEAGITRDLEWLAQPQRSLVVREDPRYPARLREIPQAPLALFCQGDTELLALPQIAIVGSRSASPQGLDNASAFAEALAARGLTVTSGLALGIDGAAHRGALKARGLSIAVCATGLDRVYPARHRALAHELVAGGGLLVSEYPVGVQALAENFPKRNRIISGLALGVLVVEAARESGSLITARQASEQGREVFAIPGSIHNPMARGCHRLIRQGAKLVESVDDILEELGPQIAGLLREAVPAPQAPPDPLLEAIGDAPCTLDELLARTGLDIAGLSAALLDAELAGRVAVTADGRYMRRGV